MDQSGFRLAPAVAAHIRVASMLVGTKDGVGSQVAAGQSRRQKRLVFHCGMQVQATGLSRREGLNGKVGTVKGQKIGSDGKQRIVVAFTINGDEEDLREQMALAAPTASDN